MAGYVKLLSIAAITGSLLGCTFTDRPTATAFSRNVGPGSSVTGRAQSDMGSRESGVTHVPGVSSAGGSPNGGN